MISQEGRKEKQDSRLNTGLANNALKSRDNVCSSLFISEGHFKNRFNSREKKKNADNDSSSNNFDFGSLNVTLLEAGVAGIGTVAVGIDIRSRNNNEWIPSTETAQQQNRNYCTLGHHGPSCQGHNHNHAPFGHQTQPALSPAGTAAGLAAIHSASGAEQHNDAQCQGTDIRPLIIHPFCSFCTGCNQIYGKLMYEIFRRSIADHLKLIPFATYFAFPHPQKLQIFDSKSEKLSLAISSTSSDSIDSGRASSASEEDKENSLVQNPSTTPAQRLRKKAIFFTEEKYAEIERKIRSGNFRKPSVNRANSDPVALKKTHSSSSTSSDDSDKDITSVFAKAAADYANRLNNIVAMDYMQSHKPDEAMKCWLNSDASSKAFFNMGVAFESGRHALSAKPDLNRAHDCYAIAASMGHRGATYNLALFYLYGKGKIPVNVDFGMSLLEAAARKGLTVAQNFLTEHRRREMLAEVKAKLQRKISTVSAGVSGGIRKPEQRRIYQRSTASMIGPKPVKVIADPICGNEETGSGGVSTLKRVHSAPNLIGLIDKRVARRS